MIELLEGKFFKTFIAVIEEKTSAAPLIGWGMYSRQSPAIFSFWSRLADSVCFTGCQEV